MTRIPALIGISHGTSSAEGQRAVTGLITAIATARPDLVVAQGFVDVQHPDPAEVLDELEPGQPAIVVPLLLSAGYHVHVDLTKAVEAEIERPVTLARPLGPDDRLIEVLELRLDDVGFGSGDELVLAVAGSSDVRAIADCQVVAERLAVALGRNVELGFLSAAEPRLGAAILQTRARHPRARIVVSSYLLAPGYFQDLAASAGGDVITDPLLRPDAPPPAQIVELVIDRYRDALPS
ncbi:MAG: cobalamin biosynthesis protein CbiX [Salinibacterium sp.]|nr:MAG: cobalamin biosynthesis protein CbiX [Salinibacterium sp.]